jgi:hypothetical protein
MTSEYVLYHGQVYVIEDSSDLGLVIRNVETDETIMVDNDKVMQY